MSNLKRGTVMLIRAGDPEISGALARGMLTARAAQAEPLSAEQIEVVTAEIDRQHIERALLRVSVGNHRTEEDYRQLITKARGDYEAPRRAPGPMHRLGNRLLGWYALAVYGLQQAYRAQGRVLERGEGRGCTANRPI